MPFGHADKRKLIIHHTIILFALCFTLQPTAPVSQRAILVCPLLLGFKSMGVAFRANGCYLPGRHVFRRCVTQASFSYNGQRVLRGLVRHIY